MGVYEDMANDAGCAFGTDENRQMAQMIECQREQAYREQCEEEQCEEEQYEEEQGDQTVMDKTLKQIIGMVLQLSEKETHPDKVSCLYAILMQVNMAIGKEMLKIRESEKA